MAEPYPIFLQLAGRRCVVVGGGPVATAKVAGLLAAGAAVRVIAPEITPTLAERRDAGQLEHIARGYQPGDLDGALLVIAATGDRALDRQIGADAAAAGALANVVDDPAACDWFTPAVARRGGFTVAISTGGRSPSAARHLREYIEQNVLTPERAQALDRIATERRARVAQGTNLPYADWQARLRAAEHSHPDLAAALAPAQPGRVYLVGAGPGHAGLLTLRGWALVSTADVIVYDRLVGDGVRCLARPDAELHFAGKHGGGAYVPQESINTLLVAAAQRGQSVVRLKGGDPFVFGRGGEEAAVLAAAGVPFEVVSGVTAAIAVPAAAGIPVTHRAVATSFAVLTGHEDPSRPASRLNWAALAQIDTLVVLMGVARLPAIVAALQAHGKPADTPAALIERGTHADQRVIEAPLGEIAERAAAARIQAPATLIIGEVVRQRVIATTA